MYGGLTVGDAGQGTLTVANGGVATTNGPTYLGYAGGSVGTITVTGAGSQFTSSSDFFIGNGGQGSLTIAAGAAVSDVNATVGALAGSTGNVLVDGGSWTNSGSLDIGTGGTGVVTIKDNGQLSAANITVGSQGSMIVDPSVVDVSGNYTLLPGGVLELDIAGTGPGSFSQLDISGTGLFEGTIDFDFIDGFAPTTGESFDLINAAGADFSDASFEIEGLQPGFLYNDSFSDGSFTLTAEDNGVSETAATPEPGSFWLLGSALTALSIAVRRKNLKARACPGKRSSD